MAIFGIYARFLWCILKHHWIKSCLSHSTAAIPKFQLLLKTQTVSQYIKWIYIYIIVYIYIFVFNIYIYINYLESKSPPLFGQKLFSIYLHYLIPSPITSPVRGRKFRKHHHWNDHSSPESLSNWKPSLKLTAKAPENRPSHKETIMGI